MDRLELGGQKVTVTSQISFLAITLDFLVLIIAYNRWRTQAQETVSEERESIYSCMWTDEQQVRLISWLQTGARDEQR